MRRLYVRIAGSIVLAVVVGWVAVGILVPRLRSLMEQSLADQLVAAGFGALVARIERTPADAWQALLDDAQRDVTLRLAIRERAQVPEAVTTGALRPMMATPGAGEPASLYVPVHAGSHYLVAGPLTPPPLAPLVVIGVVFVIVLTATASALVGIPLVRRLRAVRDALADIGGGNWATRLDAEPDDSLGEIAESVNAMASRLEQQFQEREALLQAVSHELGTPLSRLRFRLERLEEDATTPEQRVRLNALAQDLDELDGLSSELVSWMESDAPARPRRTFLVRPLLESLAELERPLNAMPADTVVVCPPESRVHADERQFQRAMENLLRNAARYASRRIVVEVSAQDDEVAIEVRDDGPGIPPEDRSRVLEPFARGQAAEGHAHRGLGLGLAIVRRIVTAHGGKLTVGQAAEGGAALRTTWKRVG